MTTVRFPRQLNQWLLIGLSSETAANMVEAGISSGDATKCSRRIDSGGFRRLSCGREEVLLGGQ